MDKYIVCCTHCGKMFKCDKLEHGYVTDFGDVFTPDKYGITTCICCHKEMDPVVIRTADWIADKVFTIKGEKY